MILFTFTSYLQFSSTGVQGLKFGRWCDSSGSYPLSHKDRLTFRQANGGESS